MDRSGVVLGLVRCRFGLPSDRDFLLLGELLVVPLGLRGTRRWEFPEHLAVLLAEPLDENPDAAPTSRCEFVWPGLAFDSVAVCEGESLSKLVPEGCGTEARREFHRDPLKEVKLVPRPVRPVAPIVKKVRQL